MLFDTDIDAFRVGLPTIIATATVSALLIGATISIAMKIRHKRVSTGIKALIGEHGYALNDFDNKGQVKIGAEIWQANSKDTISDGDEVTIESVNGLVLTVKKIEGEAS